MIKKILIVIASIILLVFLAWLFFWPASEEAPAPQNALNELPFGSGEGANTPTTYNQQPTIGEVKPIQEETDAKLFKLSSAPVAGFVVLNSGASTTARYVDRATGHISETNLSTLNNRRITNQTLPKIYEAHFRGDGNAVLLRSLENNTDEINNLALTLTPPRATSSDALYTISATNLRGDIDSVAVGSGNILYYVLRDTSAIVSSTFTGSDTRNIFNSAFNNWRLSRLGSNLLVYAKASAAAPGYAYSLSTSGGLARLLGPLNGLVVVGNPAGNRLLYSYSEDVTKLFVRNLQNNASSEILPATLAEKCVWSARESAVFFCGTPQAGVGNGEPDNWYLGRTHFSDYIWTFDSNAETARLIVEPESEFGVALDVSEPKLSPDESYLVFINKTDLTLWAVKLK
jgi:hypothetical protein